MTGNEKRLLRKKMRSIRNAVPLEVRLEKSRLIAEKILNEGLYKSCSCLCVYLSYNSETDTYRLAETALSEGKPVALPYVMDNEGNMCFIKINSLEGLVKNSYGIREPFYNEEEIYIPDDKTLIIVPGLAFTPEGQRLGYGGGYYDKYLRAYPNAAAVGICFREQLLPTLPTEEHDIRLDRVVTD